MAKNKIRKKGAMPAGKQQALASAVDRLLLQMEVKGNLPSVGIDPYQPLVDLVSRDSQWKASLGLSEVIEIAASEIYLFLYATNKDNSGKLKDILSAASYDSLRTEIINSFASIPRSYQFWFEIGLPTNSWTLC